MSDALTREEVREMMKSVRDQGKDQTVDAEEFRRLKKMMLKILRKLMTKEDSEGKNKLTKLAGGSVRIIKRVRGRRLIVERFFSEEQFRDERFWEWLIDTHGDDLCEMPRYRNWYGRSRENGRDRE